MSGPKHRRRRRPQQSRSRATVEAILDAVSRVLREGGAGAVTTNRIAKVAGVSIGTLYQYFSTKQDIFDALHERHFQELATSVGTTLVTNAPGTLDSLLVALVDAVLAVRAADPELYQLLATTVPRRPDTVAEAQRLTGAFHLAVAGHRQELRDDCDLDRFVFVLAHMIGGLTRAAVLSRPAAVTLKDARDESIAAIRAYVSRHRSGTDPAGTDPAGTDPDRDWHAGWRQNPLDVVETRD